MWNWNTSCHRLDVSRQRTLSYSRSMLQLIYTAAWWPMGAFVGKVMCLLVRRNFLTRWQTSSFSITLLHGVSVNCRSHIREGNYEQRVKDWQGWRRSYRVSWYYIGIRMEGLGKTTENVSRFNINLTEIRTVYPPNTNVQRYRYTNLLCIRSSSDPTNQE